MIAEYNAKLYCSEPIQLIENYDAAVADTTQVWDCHHRLGVRDGKTVTAELKANNMYEHRPANELIFVTQSQHKHLHHDVYSKAGKKGGKKGGKAYMAMLSLEEKRHRAAVMNSKKTPEQWVEQQRIRSVAGGKKGGKKMLGKHAWNDGVVWTWAFECPGEGWKRGRLKKGN